MKLFNPFKLHIAQRKNGKYDIRDVLSRIEAAKENSSKFVE